MATLLKLRRGTTTQHSSFTGAAGEVTVDTTKNTAVVHDGSTAGGHPLAKASDLTSYAKYSDATANFTGTLQKSGSNVLVSTDVGSSVQAYDANTAKLNVAQAYSKAQRGTAVSLTSTSASIASDFANANNFTHTFTENTTLANPSNLVAGQSGVIVFTQHASSPKTLAFGSYWKFPGGTAPTVTATNSAVDVLVYYVESTTRISARLISDVK